MDDRRIVIELLKDTTSGMFFGSDEDKISESSEIHSLIDQMNNLAFKDSLTGLYNRRYINEKLPVDMLNSALLSKEVSIIMADVDSFKNVNDCHGHAAGDYILKYFASTVSAFVKRGSDWIARFGGDEFLICMPGADLELAKHTAESIRKYLEQRENPIRQ